MGKKFFIRSTEKIEDKIRALQAEVARLSHQPRTAIYSPPEVIQVTGITPPVVEEEPLNLPELEDDAVFISSQMGAQGSADLKAVEKKTTRFEIKNVDSLKKQGQGKVK